MSELYRVLTDRDKLSHDEAVEMILDAKARVAEGEDPEEILYDEFGLEPDYVLDLF
jgi:hypothetical protein